MRILFFILLLISAAWSCNDPSMVGIDLLDDDGLELVFDDEIEIQARTVRADSVLTFNPLANFNIKRYLCGKVEDPSFGVSEASIYTGLRFRDVSSPDFINSTLDSIVLIMVYDSTSVFVGDTTKRMNFEVYEVLEEMNPFIRYYSNHSFFTGSEPIGVGEDILPSRDSRVNKYEVHPDSEVLDTVSYPPHMRITLTEEFGNRLLDFPDSSLSSDVAFQEMLNGIHIKHFGNSGSILAFNLEHDRSGISLFYHQDTVNKRFDMSISNLGFTVNQYEHDYSDVTLGNLIDDYMAGDSLVYMQSMAGVNLEILFPDLTSISDVIVNRAVLEFVVNDEDGGFFPPVGFVVPNIDNEDAELTPFQPIFGGELIREIDGDQSKQLYRVNIAGYFQDVLLGNSENRLIFTAFPKDDRAERVIIFGPGHSKYPLKLELTYTLKPL